MPLNCEKAKGSQKLISLDDAAKATLWLQKVRAGNTPDGVNARIVEGIIRGLQIVSELEEDPSGMSEPIM